MMLYGKLRQFFGELNYDGSESIVGWFRTQDKYSKLLGVFSITSAIANARLTFAYGYTATNAFAFHSQTNEKHNLIG